MNVESKAESEAARWQDHVYDLLRRNNVTQFAYVPDAGHRILIDRALADPQVHSVALTTEEEGVALLADRGEVGRPCKRCAPAAGRQRHGLCAGAGEADRTAILQARPRSGALPGAVQTGLAISGLKAGGH
jgi:hypothetical protein